MGDVRNARSPLLDDVVVIRPLVIVLLVVYHCFGIFDTWGVPPGVTGIPAYAWVYRFLQCFRMPVIVFIAGYVFNYQTNVLGREYSFGQFVKKKFMRLVVPGALFSLVYYFCFHSAQGGINAGKLASVLLFGDGHLWFLPMLFWCFVLMYVVRKLGFDRWWLFFVLLLVAPSLTVALPLPGAVCKIPRYFTFFLLGYLVWPKRDTVLGSFSRPGRVVALVVAFIAIFLGVRLLNDAVNGYKLAEGIQGWNLQNLLLSSATEATRSVMSIAGIFAVFVTVNYFLRIKKLKPRDWVYRANGLCYGVYIYHMFFVMWVYYYTSVPQMINSYLLPFVASAVILGVSVFLTWLTLKTRTGRFLMG